MKNINIANSITFFRILSAPIILWLILEEKIEYLREKYDNFENMSL